MRSLHEPSHLFHLANQVMCASKRYLFGCQYIQVREVETSDPIGIKASIP